MTDQHEPKENARNNGKTTDGRNADGTFAPGNPGRPSGARHKTTMAILELLDGQAEKLTQKAVDLALDGDTTAIRLCMERIAPPRKDTPVSFDLPSMDTAHDAAKAASAVLAAVSEGDVTPLEGATVMALVDSYRRALEVSVLERRITVLEEKT